MEENFHPIAATQTYIEVVLPISIPRTYTYYVPEEWLSFVAFGFRAEVPFGKNKLYAGLIVEVHNRAPSEHQPKSILSVIDQYPIIHPNQYRLWQWMASYYNCGLGSVMHAALPAGLKLSSETTVQLSPLFSDQYERLNDKEFLIIEALTIQETLSIDDIQGILQQKTVYPTLQKLIEKRFIYLNENLKEKYKPKKAKFIRLVDPYAAHPELLEEAFELVSRSNRQLEALMAFVQLSKKTPEVKQAKLCKLAKVDSSVVKAIQKKGIWEVFEQEISRLESYDQTLNDLTDLSALQKEAYKNLKQQLSEKAAVLLHGVTGSGKTRLYIQLMQEALERGEQVLYLLPEIALTTQIINRLKKVFGDKIAVYHSRLNNHERVELWKKVAEGHPLLLGARSSLFLPFKKLKLIVVDEEHDTSYKQQDPAPRYNARDTAVYLGHLHGAKVVLGTATPSLESYHNALQKKYGLVELFERFGGVQLPEIQIADLKKAPKSIFTQDLLAQIQHTLDQEEQVILFQNRRGYAPSTRCMTCGWTKECVNCDVSLTYHKFQQNLQCHYCGYRTQLPKTCPACGSVDLQLKGFGTEKIEDDLSIHFPEARIARLDLDTVRSKYAHSKILHEFEEGELDILVGTQMVTKGLDFAKVGLVGVLNADQLMHFPDFRATERAFQLMTQVAGRAGRKKKRGKVIIQAMQTNHPVLDEVINNNFNTFFSREITERQSFSYPPFVRLIKITLKHKRPEILNYGAKFLAHLLKEKLDKRVIGPAVPYVSRVRGYYLIDFLIKLERNKPLLEKTKAYLIYSTSLLHKEKGCSTIRVNVDVDPY